jgi:hypothetical protein
MASVERLLVFTSFVSTTIAICWSAIHLKTDMYHALQNKDGISCLTVLANKRQLIMPYGGRNHKWHSLQADILKNCDE